MHLKEKQHPKKKKNIIQIFKRKKHPKFYYSIFKKPIKKNFKKSFINQSTLNRESFCLL